MAKSGMLCVCGSELLDCELESGGKCRACSTPGAVLRSNLIKAAYDFQDASRDYRESLDNLRTKSDKFFSLPSDQRFCAGVEALISSATVGHTRRLYERAKKRLDGLFK